MEDVRSEIFFVRRAVPEDAAEIAEITKDAFSYYAAQIGQPTVSALKETTADILKDIQEKLVFIAYVNGEAVGSLRIAVQGGEAFLSRFGVRTDKRNAGVGKLLMEAADAYMIKLGISCIRLYTAAKEASLMIFYYGQGFYVDDICKNKGYTRVLMVKEYKF